MATFESVHAPTAYSRPPSILFTTTTSTRTRTFCPRKPVIHFPIALIPRSVEAHDIDTPKMRLLTAAMSPAHRTVSGGRPETGA